MRLFAMPLLLVVALLTSVCAKSARADVIVDTGSNPNGPTYLFGTSQHFAGEFSVAAPLSITSVEGFFGDSEGGGPVTIALHQDGGNVPGTILQSASVVLPAGSPIDWYGVFNLNWSVGPGDYWVSFIPPLGLGGTMPGDAPNPLSEYAVGNNGGWQNVPPDYFDFVAVGVRINATPQAATVPEPASLLVWAGIGLTGLAARRYRRKRAS